MSMEPETVHPTLLLSKSRILTIGSEEGGILRALKGDLMVHARTTHASAHSVGDSWGWKRDVCIQRSGERLLKARHGP